MVFNIQIKRVDQELTELFSYYFKMKNLGLAFNIDENVLKRSCSDICEYGYIVIEVNAEDKSMIAFSVKDEFNKFKK